MNRRDPRLSRSDAESLSDDDCFWALMEPAWDDPHGGTAGQRALAVTTYLARDVANGGLHQALWNRDGAEWDEAVAALETLGLADHADAARRASRMLLGETPPRNLEERREVLDRCELDWVREHIGPLDERFYDETKLWPRYREYIAAHPELFFRD